MEKGTLKTLNPHVDGENGKKAIVYNTKEEKRRKRERKKEKEKQEELCTLKS